MNTLFIIFENYTNGYRFEFLDVISIIAILFGIIVIITKNPIISVLFLIGLFLSISIYLMLLGLNFIGLSYLLVYVGAVSILFLFILMLINVRVSELLSNTNNSIPLAIYITIFFYYPIYQLIPYSLSYYSNYISELISNIIINRFNIDFINYLYLLFDINNNHVTNKLYFVTGKLWDGYLSEISHISSIGNIMYTSYSMWLILTSIILLLAMVGAIVITIKQND